MDRIHAATETRRFHWLGSLAAALVLAAPAGARAGDEFEDGFKDELGRMAAHEAVVVGRGVLAQVLLGGYPGYYYPVDYPTHRPRYYDDHHDHGRGHYRHHDGGHGGHYGHYGHYRPRWGHGYRGHGHGWGHYGHQRQHHRHHHRHHHGCGH